MLVCHQKYILLQKYILFLIAANKKVRKRKIENLFCLRHKINIVKSCYDF
jgi:hypothetical protein